MSLIVAVQPAETVEEHTDVPVAVPPPLSAAMMLVVVRVFSPQVPVCSHCVPACSIPTAQDAQPVEVVANAAETSSEPTIGLVIMVAPPQVPVRAHLAPMALVIPVQRAVPIQVRTDVAVAAPCPAMLAVELVVVVVPAVQAPVGAHLDPAPAVVASGEISVSSSWPQCKMVRGCDRKIAGNLTKPGLRNMFFVFPRGSSTVQLSILSSGS